MRGGLKERPGIEHDARSWLKKCQRDFPFFAIQPAKVRDRSARRQANSPAHHHNGPPSPTAHFRKRSNLSEHGASRAAAFAAPHALRSYRAMSQTLLSQSPPLAVAPHGATRYSRREVPTLVTSYCATQRHCLRTSLAFRLPLGFTSPMFHSSLVTRVVHHRLRTTASCLWLCVAPHSTHSRVPLQV